MRRREQGSTLFTGAMWLIGTGVVVQLWLVAGALEALLAGHREALLPAAAASAAVLAWNAVLLWGVLLLDRRIRKDGGTS